jgi:hypothetical protein
MTAPTEPLNDRERTLLADAMDRLVPPIDALPGAGAMGLTTEVEALARRHAPYHRALSDFIRALATTWSAALPDRQKDALLTELEASAGGSFNAVLELVYLAYYGDPRVHKRVGWRGGPLQPDGFPLRPFDPEILKVTRQRRPFWRQT